MADEQPGDNARACPPWCVIQHDGQHALDDLVHEGDPERTGQTTPATHAAGETDAASPEEVILLIDRPTGRRPGLLGSRQPGEAPERPATTQHTR